jgi:hypothetical protein
LLPGRRRARSAAQRRRNQVAAGLLPSTSLAPHSVTVLGPRVVGKGISPDDPVRTGPGLPLVPILRRAIDVTAQWSWI